MNSYSPDYPECPVLPAATMLSSEAAQLGAPAGQSQEIRLHIGGVEPKAGWKILNIQPGPHVDFVGSCTDLTGFADGSVAEIYASHVFEHLGYQEELPQVMAGIRRVLRPGGTLRISVPDLEVLCRMFVHPALSPEARFHVMRIIYGGQMDTHDFHKVGFTFQFLTYFLAKYGFRDVRRVASHDLFDDTSRLVLFGHPISLNVVAST
ncbi:MAG TPA: methyltransferase domain-containing protein [Geminicoccus sp.]|uniref:class I SAM-dependent methyltransferase n=1 Tax=Geminicoccus sp. TaxID=2024832 RepID=UPI002B54EE49|nr:methyltransferase domain-containing protein [Geminicoccus sp.]HWL69987.1 methyltransferase domain-containing protein [Geminicoccus sp.]